MSEFSGYCPRCHIHEDVCANKPCPGCGGKMIITAMDGMRDRDFDPKDGE